MEHETQHTEETNHHKKNPKKQHVVAGVIVGIAVIIAGGFAWLYTGQISSAKEKVFSAIPFPAALVDMRPVSAKSVIDKVNLSKQIAQEQGLTETAPAAEIFNQHLEVEKVKTLVTQRNLTVSNEDIDAEYQNIIDVYAAGDSDAFSKELEATYKMTPEEFKAQVVKQEMLQSQLMLWYNQQENLNEKSYQTAKDLQDRLNKGESFDDIARQYSEDEATKDFAGDSGTIAFDDLLPEFKTSLSDSKVGDVKLVPSRFGLHILKVLELNNDGENGAKQIHLQQIFIKQIGFAEWLKQEADNIRTIKLLKF